LHEVSSYEGGRSVDYRGEDRGCEGPEKKKNRADAVCVNSVGKASILWEEKIGL